MEIRTDENVLRHVMLLLLSQPVFIPSPPLPSKWLFYTRGSVQLISSEDWFQLMEDTRWNSTDNEIIPCSSFKPSLPSTYYFRVFSSFRIASKSCLLIPAFCSLASCYIHGRCKWLCSASQSYRNWQTFKGSLLPPWSRR